MTKIQLPFTLSAPLDEKQMDRIADLYKTYGILRVNVAGQELVVEYDASRLGPQDVRSVLARAGLPIAATAV
jgi:hypothetical protein